MENQSMKHLELPDAASTPAGCGLKYMMDNQKELNERIYPIVLANLRRDDHVNTKVAVILERDALTKEYLLAIIRECAEALDMLNSKPWKKTQKEIDVNELKFEFIDIQHFVCSLYDVWTMSRDEVMQYYMAKNKENHNRVERNY